MSKPLMEVEVVAHVLGSMDHCSHCQVFIDGAGIGDQVHQSEYGNFIRRIGWRSGSDYPA